jgi:hypothetical protein
MTQHELLAFVDFLHVEMQRHGWSVWPTREIVVDNLAFNAALWGPRWPGEYGDTRQTLLRKRWLAEGPCSQDCHAVHIRLTEAGQEALRLMNADPEACRSHIHVRRRPHCHQNFKARGVSRDEASIA